MDRRLATIRCVLLVALGVACFGWGWFWVGLASVGLGLMMPVFAGGGGGGCTPCSFTSLEFDSVGPTGGFGLSCTDPDCAAYNTTTFTVTCPGSCTIGGASDDCCCGANAFTTSFCRMLVFYNQGTTTAVVQGYEPSSLNFIASWGGTGPDNCGGGPFSCNGQSPGSHDCDFSSSSVLLF